MKRLVGLVFTIAVCLLLAMPASAATYTVSSGNSTFVVDDCVAGCSQGHGPGMYSWTVDGQENLYQQWFWYRVGTTGGENSVNALTLLSATMVDAEDLKMVYEGTGFTIELKYSLSGGQAGSHTADIGEQIKINNTGSTALDMHFFQYSDFDLNRTNLSDWVSIDPNLHVVNQWAANSGSSFTISESTVNQKPSHAEANYFANTLNKLNDSSPTTLDGVLKAGPGDTTWAFQWDTSIAAGGSYVISKDKLLAPAVPEPAAVLLFGGVLLLVGRKFRPRSV